MNFIPLSTTHPTRRPFVRELSYVDLKGPPPVEFFDGVQDHMGALFHGRLGWAWSVHREDFDAEFYPANKMGIFSVFNFAAGLTLSAAPPGLPIIQGEHGVWRGISGAFDYDVTLTEHANWVGTKDFLVSAKVLCLNSRDIDIVDREGFWVGCGLRVSTAAGDVTDGIPNAYPALCGGAGTANWQVWCPPAAGKVGLFYDTGIPFLDSQNTQPDQVRRAWHVLQISRLGGVMRFFVDGRLARLTGNGLSGAEGIYYPADLRAMRRFFRCKRRFLGLANTGFYIDFFHRLCRRS